MLIPIYVSMYFMPNKNWDLYQLTLFSMAGSLAKRNLIEANKDFCRGDKLERRFREGSKYFFLKRSLKEAKKILWKGEACKKVLRRK